MTSIFTNLMNTINNSKFLSVLISAIIIFIFISLIIYIIRLLSNIRMYIVNKSNSFYLANQKLQNNDKASLPMTDRVELTNSILDLIAFMVNNEIVSLFKNYISLNELYVISNIDKDAANISNNVFNGINENLFKDPNLILTDKYLMEYISKKSISTLIDVAQTHNSNIRTSNQSGEE